MNPENPETPSVDPAIETVTVPFSRGFRWIGDGLAYFLRDPLPWMGAAVVFMFFTLVGMLAAQAQLAVVMIVFLLVSNVLSGGFFRGCDAQARGERFRITHVFSCFAAPAPFIMLSVMTLCGMLLIIVFLQMLEPDMVNRAVEAAQAGIEKAPELDTLRAHLMFGLIPLLMALYFAPVLLALHRVRPLTAMQLSLVGVVRNLLAFLPLLLLSALLMQIAILTGGVLLIIVLPILFAANYVAYKDVFRSAKVAVEPSEPPPPNGF